MIDKLDKTDIEILRLLQQNSNRTIKNIADVLGMTTTPIFDRIKKLEKKGFIDKYAAILNSRMLGLKLTVFVGITLKNHTMMIHFFNHHNWSFNFNAINSARISFLGLNIHF